MTTLFTRSQLIGQIAVIAFASFGLASSSVFAASTLTLIQSGAWEDTSNWNPHQVPGAGDTAVINGLIATKNGGTLTASTVKLSGGGLQFNQDCLLNANVTANQNSFASIGLESGSTLTIASTATVSGDFSIIGTANQSGQADRSLINNGVINLTGFGSTLYNVTNNNIIQVIDDSLNFRFHNGINGSNGVISISGGAELASFDGINNGKITVDNNPGSNDFSGANNGTLTLGSSTTTGNGTGFFFNGTNTGTINVINTRLYSTSIGSNGNGGTSTGTFNFNKATLLGTLSMTGDAVLNVTHGLTIDGFDSNYGGSLTFAGKAINYDNLALANGANLALSGNQTLNGPITFGGTNAHGTACEISLDGTGSGSVLTIAGGTTILSGDIGSIGHAYQGSQANVSVINNGTIFSTAVGMTTSLYNVTNNGSIITDGAIIDFQSTPYIGNGTLTIINAKVIAGGGILQNSGQTTVNGTLAMNASTFVLKGGTVVGARTINGSSGVVALNNTGGIVAPGNEARPGALTINGDFAQGKGGTLLEELGGTVAGVGYSQLVVNGTATLDGTLELSLVNGFTPTVGETFDVISSSNTLLGDFTDITSADAGYSYAYSNNGGIGTVTVLSAVTVPEANSNWLVLIGAVPAVFLLRRRPIAER